MSVELSKIELEYHELPESWAWIKLSEVCNPINGRAFKSSDWKNHGLPIIRIQNLKNRNATFNYFEGIPDEKHLVRAGDLLFAWSGTPGTSFGAHIWNGPLAVLNQHIFRIEFDDKQLDPKYFLYALNQNVTRYVQQAQGGVGLAHITKRKFLDSQIPIAPITDQKRIVAEIEKQFSRLDEAVTSLKRAKANLKRYKAAVLKAAVEGKLTEQWRKQHPDVEPASELLKRILADRRRKWEEAELAKMRAKGIEPKDDKWKKKYEEPTEPNIKDRPIIPSSWSWATPAQLASHENYSLAIGPFGSNLKVSDYRDSGVPLVFVKNIRSESFDTNKYISFAKAEELKAHMIRGGEILITKMGEPPGDACSYPLNLPAAIITADCIKWQLTPEIEIDFFSHVINSRIVKTQIQEITKGVAQQKMSLARFKTIAVPLPPKEEQNAACIEIESRFSATYWAEDLIESGIKRADGLRQSILTKAFSGNLKGD